MAGRKKTFQTKAPFTYSPSPTGILSDLSAQLMEEARASGKSVMVFIKCSADGKNVIVSKVQDPEEIRKMVRQTESELRRIRNQEKMAAMKRITYFCEKMIKAISREIQAITRGY